MQRCETRPIYPELTKTFRTKAILPDWDDRMALCGTHQAGGCSVTDDQRRTVARRAEKWELLAGRLAWLKVLGSAALPVLAGFALLAGWSWWYAGYAFISICMGKWLAHSFENHRQRIIFEAERMVNGMASAEFRTEWVEAYTGGN
jgi:hypothetical protein